MASRGRVIPEYADRLPMLHTAPTVTLQEGGGTPLIPCEKLSERVGRRSSSSTKRLNPTGSFKDRGMTTAMSMAKNNGAN